MSERFQEKYRIPSTRLQNCDYGWNAVYFITLCTAGHEHQFGKIADGEIFMSDIGLLAKEFWYEIPQHFKFIELDAFVVMPNHIHGILIINKNGDGRYINYDSKDATGRDAAGRDAINRVSTVLKIKMFIRVDNRLFK
jgi:putative transposase